mmetsp:Transcript_43412/g.85269  ORF Transcript_43412/g.85269 Transcript_43412/m.85269 type:complete len:137 (+) Transcript_43412:172-582(+)
MGDMMLSPEQENDREVRRADQERIGKFGRLNARLHEVRSERGDLKAKMERIDDASTDLMMGSGDRVSIRLGAAFFETSEEEATEHCEELVEGAQTAVDALGDEEASILAEQAELKRLLYARFGASINLEEGGPPKA